MACTGLLVQRAKRQLGSRQAEARGANMGNDVAQRQGLMDPAELCRHDVADCIEGRLIPIADHDEAQAVAKLAPAKIRSPAATRCSCGVRSPDV
eukprot:9783382-Alexandrium_andersonii.AAC.1